MNIKNPFQIFNLFQIFSNGGENLNVLYNVFTTRYFGAILFTKLFFNQYGIIIIPCVCVCVCVLKIEEKWTTERNAGPVGGRGMTMRGVKMMDM